MLLGNFSLLYKIKYKNIIHTYGHTARTWWAHALIYAFSLSEGLCGRALASAPVSRIRSLNFDLNWNDDHLTFASSSLTRFNSAENNWEKSTRQGKERSRSVWQNFVTFATFNSLGLFLKVLFTILVWIGPSGKLLCGWRTKNIMQHMHGTIFNTCLTIGLISFIHFLMNYSPQWCFNDSIEESR